jgi:hypothetical protein
MGKIMTSYQTSRPIACRKILYLTHRNVLCQTNNCGERMRTFCTRYVAKNDSSFRLRSSGLLRHVVFRRNLLSHRGMETVCSSETSIFLQDSRCHNPKDLTLKNHRLEYLKTYSLSEPLNLEQKWRSVSRSHVSFPSRIYYHLKHIISKTPQCQTVVPQGMYTTNIRNPFIPPYSNSKQRKFEEKKK